MDDLKQVAVSPYFKVPAPADPDTKNEDLKQAGGALKMRDVQNLKLIASAHCTQYNTEARFYIDASGKQRHLVVHYENGGYRGAPEFATGIPDYWTEQDVMDLLLWPMKEPDAPYPPWEVPVRAHGSPTLFRWWAGEKPGT